MKRANLISISVGLFVCLFQAKAQTSHEKDPVDYVNPLIGTDNSSHPTVWASQGATFPGVLVPFGMVQITPDGYTWQNDKISWFSFINHCSGWFSIGNFHLMASTGSIDSPFHSLSSHFTHEEEKATPYCYRVRLLDYGIQFACTASARVGLCQFVFPKSAASHLLLSDLSETMVLSPNQIKGKSAGYYFSAQLSRPFQSFHYLPSGIQLDYSTSDSEVVMIKIAFSRNSYQAALNNMEQEMPAWDFDQSCQDNRKIWNEQLSKIVVSDSIYTPKEQEKKTIFYTAMYHSFFMPALLSDPKEKIKKYAPIYPWDTYRTEQPLITLLDSQRECEMISSTLDQYDSTGWLPTGNMMGNHNFEVILDAYMKGLTNFDINKACEAIRKSSMVAPYARRQMAPFVKYGYVPADITSSVTHTLEFAYDDWAAASFIKNTGHLPEYKTDYTQLLKRAYYYQNVFDPTSAFMHAKTLDGNWTSGGYAEGTEWTYSFYVPHDVHGLINLMRGPKGFCAKLSNFFEAGHYVHDNEPPMHYAYLFDFAGQPWKTQQWVRSIVENSYSNDPGGIPGNDDLGALSSWYVFSALGFYPVTPGIPVYEIGSPIFEESKIHLSNEKDFIIKAHHVSGINKYIQSASLDGKPLNKAWITHEDITRGKTLVFEMGSKPNKKWASDIKDAPPSITKGSPRFLFSDLKISGHKSLAGKPIKVSVTIENKGAGTGTATCIISVDGKMMQEQFFVVEAGTKKQVYTDLMIYHAGYHEIKVNQLKPQKIEVLKVAASFQYSGLMTAMPPMIRIKDSFAISAKVKNIGSSSGVALAKLYINSKETQSQKIVLAAGGEREIKFIASIEKQGIYQVTIDTIKPAMLRVSDSVNPPLPDASFFAQHKAACVLDFDQGPDSIVSDQSGRGNHARVIGKIKWVDGIFGKAIQTNGPKGDYIEIPANPELDKLSKSPTMTLMAWVYPMEEQNFADILSKGDWISLQVKGGNGFINFYTGGWEGREASVAVPENWNRHWHHIAGVTQPPYNKLYVDGKLAAIKLIEPRDPNGETGLSDYSHNKWCIGRNDNAPERAFNGYIDDVMIFKNVLTEKEIFDLMLHIENLNSQKLR